MAAPTQEELDCLKKFKENISDLLDGFTEFLRTDALLLGWLRARELNIAKAEEMIRKSVVWRKENDFENAVNWHPPARYVSLLPFDFSGYTTNRNPVLIVPFGKWDVRNIVEAPDGLQTFTKYTQYIFGHISKHLVSQSRIPDDVVSQFVVILDFDQYSFRQLGSSKCIRAVLDLVKNFEDNCPEMLHSCYIINAPKIFSLLFALVKPLLTMRTLGKIEIFGYNSNLWKPVLVKHIPTASLPPKYGGTGDNIEYSEAFLGKSTQTLDSNSEDDMITDSTVVIVQPGKTEAIEFHVTEINSSLTWAYKTKVHDIGFSIKYQEHPTNTESVVYPYEKSSDSHRVKQEGMITCDKVGKYALIFDNSYSRFRSKTVYYSAQVFSSTSENQQLDIQENLDFINLNDE